MAIRQKIIESKEMVWDCRINAGNEATNNALLSSIPFPLLAAIIQEIRI